MPVRAGKSLHLAVALDGAGWHPAAWREPSARPAELFSASYWADLAREAEAGALDFLTIEDSLGIQSADRFAGPDGRTDQVRGRLDAVLIAARIAPLTSHIGLVPTAVTTHTEPFHLSTALATLDYASEGRAGWRARVSTTPDEARHFGRREFPALSAPGFTDPGLEAHLRDIFDEAADAVEVVRRLWDSWEDDAVIRDVPTGRFVDRDKLHYIDFEGQWFSVRGPSITPRPPQGQPVVVSLAHGPIPYLFAARASDIVFITPSTAEDAVARTEQVRAAEALAGRSPAAPGSPSGFGSEIPQGGWGAGAPHPGGHRGVGPRGLTQRSPAAPGSPSGFGSETPQGGWGAGAPHLGGHRGVGPRGLALYADLVVFLDDETGAAAARKARLDALDGAEFTTDCATFTGTPAELADLLLDWQSAAGLDGFRLRPGALPDDLERITRSLVPELRRRGVFRTEYTETTLRERLGLPRPASRYEVRV